jgi:hypothetical protein
VRVDTPITVEDAGNVIRNFIESGKFDLHSRVKIDLLPSDTFDLLPDEVRKAAEDAGGTKDNTYAVLHKDGSIWLILDAYTTMERLEKSICHRGSGGSTRWENDDG